MPSSETNVDLSVADVTSPSQAQTSGVETHAHEVVAGWLVARALPPSSAGACIELCLPIMIHPMS